MVTRTPISGASDHGISEAIYLPDPDGNGIELAADRGRERWGDLSDPKTIGPEPLDMTGLLGMVDGQDARPEADPGMVVGHVHLHVGDLERAAAFYHSGLGLDKTVWNYPGALFLSAGGYHHHLGTNTWAAGAPPAAADDARLLEWEVVVPKASDAAEVAQSLTGASGAVRSDGSDWLAADPWGTVVRIRAEAGTRR
jgi:catechol 2,3-dioxygenase